MTATYAPNLAHVGVCVFDIDKMADFYCKVFGLQVADKGPGKTFPYMLAFLSGNKSQHHQLALAQNRPTGSTSTVMQLSFMVDTLDDLREARTRALREGATQMRGLNHGNAISIYFMDPENNTVEVYLDTPWYVAQPHGDPLDLGHSDEAIWAETEKNVRADPTFKPVEEWSDAFGQKIQAGR
jgi:catechol 2,3-dioxygenase